MRERILIAFIAGITGFWAGRAATPDAAAIMAVVVVCAVVARGIYEHFTPGRSESELVDSAERLAAMEGASDD